MTAGRAGLTILGRAVTSGQALPLGSDDPVVAARAVRLALADAGRRAIDVTDLVLATTDTVAADSLTAFVRRALGPYGDHVHARCLVIETGDAAEIAGRAANQLGGTPAEALAEALGGTPAEALAEALGGTPAEALAEALGGTPAEALAEDGIGLAVGLDRAGTTVALCLGRAATARGADPPPGAT